MPDDPLWRVHNSLIDGRAQGDAGLTCARLQTGIRNCGACGHACGTNEVCSAGSCMFMCASPTDECSRASTGGDGGSERYCADFSSDRANCGGCGRACPDGYACRMGACHLACSELLVACPASAGDAGVADASAAVPDGTVPVVPEVCTDTTAAPRNCGACGTACAFGQVCLRGRCTTTCGVGFTDCSGACRDLQSDRTNCGACGTRCASGQDCESGVCQVACAAGTTNCSGACRDLQSDNSNCGACGTACPAGQVCSRGACVSGRRGGGGGGGSIGTAAAADLAVDATFQPGSGGGGGGDEGTGGGGGGGALRVATTGTITVTATARLLANGGSGYATACAGGAGGGGSGGVVFIYGPTLNIASGAVVSAVGGAGGAGSGGSAGGAGGLGRIRIAAASSTCTLSGTFTPPLVSGCAVTPSPGTQGSAYVASFPN